MRKNAFQLEQLLNTNLFRKGNASETVTTCIEKETSQTRRVRIGGKLDEELMMRSSKFVGCNRIPELMEHTQSSLPNAKTKESLRRDERNPICCI